MPYSSRKTMKKRPKTKSKKSSNYTRKNSTGTKKGVKTGNSIKSFIAPEKKRFNMITSGTVGAGGGQYATVDITPPIAQGVGEADRVGLKCLLKSARFDLQLVTQVNAVNDIKYKYYIVCLKDASQPVTGTVVVNDCFEPNIFSGNYDWHSQRNPDFNHAFTMVCQGQGTIKADSIAGQNGIAQIMRPLRLDLPQKYSSNVSTTSLMNNLFLVMFTDTGSTAGGTLTGLTATASIRYWFVDV